MTEPLGLDLLLTDFPGVVIVVMKRIPGDPPESEERVIRAYTAPAEKLQAIMDKAAKELRDPSRPETPPFPDRLLSRLTSPPGSSRPIGRARIGPGR